MVSWAPSRRALLGAVCATALAGPMRAATFGMPQVVACDWSGGQNLLALDIVPLALPEVERYRLLVVEPALPASMRDLGLRSEPNLELVMDLAPDLILLGNDHEAVRDRIARIASVEIFSPDGFDGSDPIRAGAAALSLLARRLKLEARYEAFMRSFEADMAAAGQRLRGYDGRPVFIATVIDGRRLLLFGENSMYQNVLDRFGISNAWNGFTTAYGHVTVTADRLLEQPEARLLCVGDSSATALETLLGSPVIASLPFVREGRVARIADVLFYGGLPAARRFARLSSTALSEGG